MFNLGCMVFMQFFTVPSLLINLTLDDVSEICKNLSTISLFEQQSFSVVSDVRAPRRAVRGFRVHVKDQREQFMLCNERDQHAEERLSELKRSMW